MSFEEIIERANEKVKTIDDYDQYVAMLKYTFEPICAKGYPKPDFDNRKYYLYYQYCSYRLIEEIIVKKNLVMPFHAQIYGLTILPDLYHILNVGLTHEEWHNKKQEILDGLDDIFGAESTMAVVNKLRQMISIDTDAKANNVSSLAMYNYLYGFTADYNFVDKKLTELDKSYNYVLINASCNLDKEDALIMYKNIPKMDTKLLKKEMLPDYVPYTDYPVKSTKELHHVINNKSHKWKIGIDYNNGFGTVFVEELDDKEIKKFLAGKLYASCNSSMFEIEMRRRWAFRLNEDKEGADVVETRISHIPGIVSDCFSKDQYLTIKRLTEKLQDWLINKNEQKYFNIYMENATSIEKWDKDFLSDYIRTYFDFP